jgi:hypothetical protein
VVEGPPPRARAPAVSAVHVNPDAGGVVVLAGAAVVVVVDATVVPGWP